MSLMNEFNIIRIFNQGICAVMAFVQDMFSEIDSLKGTIHSLITIIADLKNTNRAQAQKITDLEARLNKNSKNSSKPPSTEGFRKPIQNNRIKSGKRSGGQYGHKGSTLEKVDNPDFRFESKIPDFCTCGHILTGVEFVKKTRQVFDIPKIQIQVTEYISYEYVCPLCGQVHKAEFPVGVTQPTQYGEQLKSFMNYFSIYHLLPLQRTCEVIADITGQSVSEGTLVNSANALSEILAKPVEEIKNRIINSDVVHFDETGNRVDGALNWVHVACTDKLTYLASHQKRGKEAAKDIDILPNYYGTAVHDHLPMYYYFTNCTQAECNDHNTRYLKDVVENYQQDWANELRSFLFDTKRRVEELILSGAVEMPPEEILMLHERYHQIIAKGILEDEEKSPIVLNKKGKPKKSKPLLLLLKLQQYDEETLRFLSDFRVPFGNNQAERDLRMVKLRQKISGCFRGDSGADTFTRIRSYISTARKNGVHAMEAITAALKGQPFIPAE